MTTTYDQGELGPIADYSASTFTMDLPNTVIADLNVHLIIAHTFNSDLEVVLESPSGTTVSLFDRIGGGSENFFNTVLDDEAEYFIGDGSAPYSGNWTPAGSLSDLDGENALGTWQLHIYDYAEEDTGTLVDWALEISESCD